MNRKHNPLVALVAMLLLAVLLLLVGCSETSAAAPESSPRFMVRVHEGIYNLMDAFIITDTETGVQYLMVEYHQGIGLTVLQPAPEEVTTS